MLECVFKLVAWIVIVKKIFINYRLELIKALIVIGISCALPYSAFASAATAEVIPLPVKTAPTFEVAFSPKQGATQLITATIAKAKSTICLAAYSFTSETIAQALIAAKERGVEVKVILDKSQLKQNSVARLLQENDVTVKFSHKYSIMHNKFIIIDDNTLQLGSFNYTKSAEAKNAENVLIINHCSELASQYAKQWQKIWDEAEAKEKTEAK